jgi:predicted transposase YbfD/YdcC
VDCCSSPRGRARGDLGRRAALWAPVPNGEFTTILVQRQCYTDLTVRTRNVPPSDNLLHVFSACVARQRIVLGRQASAEKSNEITAIPLWLKHLDPQGALITTDTMGTRTGIARAIRDLAGDHCMPLMKNRPATYDDVEELFSGTPDNVVFRTNETVNVTEARIETLRLTVCHKGGLVRASNRRITAFNTLSEFPERRRRPGQFTSGIRAWQPMPFKNFGRFRHLEADLYNYLLPGQELVLRLAVETC